MMKSLGLIGIRGDLKVGKLNLIKISPESFEALVDKDKNAIYFLDNGKIYIGNNLYGGSRISADSNNALIERADGLFIPKNDKSPILMQTYENVNSVNDIPLYYAEIFPINKEELWEVNVKIKVNIKGEPLVYQVADLYLGGIDSTLSYWEVKNFISNEEYIEVSSNLFLPSIEDGASHLLGINLSNISKKERTIKIELYNNSNCEISFKSDMLFKTNNNYSEIDFSKNGIYFSTKTKTGEFADVAFSGSYKDLIDTPDLLQVEYDIDNEKAIFYKEGMI